MLARAGVAVILAIGLAGGCAGSDETPPSTTIGTAPPVETTTTTEPPLEAGKQIFLYIPSTGDCFDKRKIPGQNKKQTEIVLKLDCTLPHQYEVYATIDVPIDHDTADDAATDADTDAYPGDEVIRARARLECPKGYREYVGAAYEVSRYEIGYLIPPETNWPNEHTVGCYVYDPSGQKLVDSVQGAAR